jgi:hypothetical protein
MTPYELRYKIFETALSIAEGESFMRKEIADSLFANGVSEETIQEYIDTYPEYPTVERITTIAREINKFVSEST